MTAFLAIRWYSLKSHAARRLRPASKHSATWRCLGSRTASWAEVMAFIEREKLYGLGCGFVDIALLASTCVTPEATLWTLDKKLLDLAGRFGVQFALPTKRKH